MTRELLEGTKENRMLPDNESLILHYKQINDVFTKKKIKKMS